MKPNISSVISKAERSLQVAERLLETGDYDFCSSRAYYAAFYAMEAALLTKNIVVSKHSGVIASFNRHFVRTGIFPRHFSKLISRLYRERHLADYVFDARISRADAQQNMEASREIVRAIKEYLMQQKWLTSE